MATIVLTLDSVSVTLGEWNSKFVEGTFPREDIQAQSVEFSAYGTPGSKGISYRSPQIWNIAVQVTPEIGDRLDRMATKSALLKTDVTIIDKTRRFSELTPRTRAIASGTTEVIEDGMVSYFAQFKGRFTAPLRSVEEGPWRRISLQLTETARVPA